MLSLVVVGLMAAVAAVAVVPRAFADEPFDIVWRPFTGEPAEDRLAYAKMITEIRNRVAARGNTVRPVNPDNGQINTVGVTAQGATDVIVIRVFAQNGDDLAGGVSLFMSLENMYIYAFETFTGTATETRFFPLERGFRSPRSVTATQGAGQVDTRFEGTFLNYNDLARQGAGRDGMRIGAVTLDNAARTLQNAGAARNDAVAGAVVQMAVGVAEAARFQPQFQATLDAMGAGREHTLPPEHVALHTNWALLSGSLLAAVIGGVAVLAAPITIGTLTLITVAEVAAVLAIAHHSNKRLP